MSTAAKPKDLNKQAIIGEAMEKKWNCECRAFAHFSPIDFYCIKDRNLWCVVEIKGANYTYEEWDNALLNLRKWLALQLARAGLGCPALFVVGYNDQARWIDLSDVDGTRIRAYGGKREDRRGPSDGEPLIEIPREQLHYLCDMPKIEVGEAR